MLLRGLAGGSTRWRRTSSFAASSLIRSSLERQQPLPPRGVDVAGGHFLVFDGGQQRLDPARAAQAARRVFPIAAPARGSSSRPRAPWAPRRSSMRASAVDGGRLQRAATIAAPAARPAPRYRSSGSLSPRPNSRTVRSRSSSGAPSSATVWRAKSNILASSLRGVVFLPRGVAAIERVEQSGQGRQLPGGVLAGVRLADLRKRRGQACDRRRRRWPGRRAVRAARPAAPRGDSSSSTVATMSCRFSGVDRAEHGGRHEAVVAIPQRQLAQRRAGPRIVPFAQRVGPLQLHLQVGVVGQRQDCFAQLRRCGQMAFGKPHRVAAHAGMRVGQAPGRSARASRPPKQLQRPQGLHAAVGPLRLGGQLPQRLDRRACRRATRASAGPCRAASRWGCPGRPPARRSTACRAAESCAAWCRSGNTR